MVDDFDCDSSAGWFSEGTAGVAVEGFPSLFVGLGFETTFELFEGIIRAEKVGVADKEAFFVVVHVNERTGNAAGVVLVAAPLTGFPFICSQCLAGYSYGMFRFGRSKNGFFI